MRIALGLWLAALLLVADGASAARVCGPRAQTLAQNARARVYVADGIVLGCHQARARRPARLGRREQVLEARVAGRFAGVLRARRLTVVDLRGRRKPGDTAVQGVVTRWILDRAGIAALIDERASAPTHVVSSTAGGPIASGADIDPGVLGLAAGVVAFRRGDEHQVAPLDWEVPRPAAARTLLRVGQVRIRATFASRFEQTTLVARHRGARRRLGPAKSACGSSSGCSEIDALQIRGTFVATRRLAYDSHGGSAGSLTVHALAGGGSRRLCVGAWVGTFVLTDAGAVACAMTRFGKTLDDEQIRQIRAGRQVIAEGPGIDIRSLRRRGEQLVWLQDGAEQTAPLPAP